MAAQATPVIQNGLFVGYLTSRETAATVGQPRSSGAMRADGWNRIPLIRMTNVSLLPGTWELDNLIADTDDGIFLETNRSWSIDDRRLNFQFGCEIGWEIRGGKRGRMLKNPSYSGKKPFADLRDNATNEKKVLADLEALKNASDWRGVNNQLAALGNVGYLTKPSFRQVRNWYEENDPQKLLEIRLNRLKVWSGVAKPSPSVVDPGTGKPADLLPRGTVMDPYYEELKAVRTGYEALNGGTLPPELKKVFKKIEDGLNNMAL